MTPTQTAERLLELPDGEDICISDGGIYRGVCASEELSSLATQFLALEPLCRELVTEIEAGRGGYVAFQKIRKVLNG